MKSMEKKEVFLNFQKLAGLWFVGEVENHVAIYGSKVAEGFSAFQRLSCSLIIFKLGKDIHCLKISDGIDYGGSLFH